MLMRIKGRARSAVTGRAGRVAAFVAPLVGGVAAMTGNASAAITLESNSVTAPLGEVSSQVGPILVAVIVGFLGAMAVVALAKAAFKLGKRLIHAL